MALISLLSGILGGTAGAGGTAAVVAPTVAATTAGTTGGLTGLLSSLGGSIGGSTGATIGSTIGSGVSSAGSALLSALPESVSGALTTAGEAVAGAVPEALTTTAIQEGGLAGLLEAGGLETLGSGVGELAGSLGELDALIGAGTNAVLDPVAEGLESAIQTVGLDQPLNAVGNFMDKYGTMASDGVTSVVGEPVPNSLNDTIGTRLSNLPTNLAQDAGNIVKEPFNNMSDYGNSMTTPQGRTAGIKNYMQTSIDNELDNAGSRQQSQQMAEQQAMMAEKKRLADIEREKQMMQQRLYSQYGGA